MRTLAEDARRNGEKKIAGVDVHAGARAVDVQFVAKQ